jgi:deferrochelatase/peroxidase EfeB
MSMTVIADPDPEQDACLAIEISSDRDPRTTLKLVGEALQVEMKALFSSAGLDGLDAPIGDFLARHNRTIGQGLFSHTLGLTFSGSPAMTVERIRNEQWLARLIGEGMSDILANGDSPIEKVRKVRHNLWLRGDSKWAFFAEPIPWSGWQPGSALMVLLLSVVPTLIKLFWPLFLLFAAAAAYAGWRAGGGLVGRFLTAGHAWIAWSLALVGGLVSFVIAFVVLVAVVGGLLVGLKVTHLRSLERRDRPDDTTPDAEHVGEVMAHENFSAQNLLATISPMKPGLFRRFLLRLALTTIGKLGGTLYKPGFLGDIGVIHFARWVLLPDPKNRSAPGKLLFWSNYDGSLEAYLEDFIERAHEGVTAIWSNTQGFPKTRLLFIDGAQDGDRLRRFVLRAQNPVRFWSSAYPDLPLVRIRTNAMIRDGVASVRTDEDAAAWLACFGTANAALSGQTTLLTEKETIMRRFANWMGRRTVPHRPLECDHIPTLAFGGRSHLRFGAVLLVKLTGDSARHRAWLRQIEPMVTYGTEKTDRALTVGLAASALDKLDLPQCDIATFPPAYRNGMTASWRSRALGDVVGNEPGRWDWGNAAKPVDVVLIVYADSEQLLNHEIAQLQATVVAGTCSVVKRLPMKPLDARTGDSRPPMREPFGFADGLSQPIIRGGLKEGKPGAGKDMVEAGEFILGYRDNLGYLPSTPTVKEAHDRHGMLYRDGADATAPRDLGRNGSFLVVRQLRQDTTGFNDWLDASVINAARTHAALGQKPFGAMRTAIAAKLVGRWYDGSPLPLHPAAPGRGPGANFTYGATDPSGLVCPFGAHMRRANPRDTLDPGSRAQLSISNRHRILRVGRPYDNAPDDKGLIFICVNSEISRQFEFVQQTWLLGKNFNGLQDEVDPMIGHSPRFTIPTPLGPLQLVGPPSALSRPLGGAYFFMPGRDALHFLAQGGWISSGVAATAVAGEQV